MCPAERGATGKRRYQFIVPFNPSFPLSLLPLRSPSSTMLAPSLCFLSLPKPDLLLGLVGVGPCADHSDDFSATPALAIKRAPPPALLDLPPELLTAICRACMDDHGRDRDRRHQDCCTVVWMRLVHILFFFFYLSSFRHRHRPHDRRVLPCYSTFLFPFFFSCQTLTHARFPPHLLVGVSAMARRDRRLARTAVPYRARAGRYD